MNFLIWLKKNPLSWSSTCRGFFLYVKLGPDAKLKIMVVHFTVPTKPKQWFVVENIPVTA